MVEVNQLPPLVDPLAGDDVVHANDTSDTNKSVKATITQFARAMEALITSLPQSSVVSLVSALAAKVGAISNLGASGASVLKDITSSTLNARKIIGGTNVTVTENSDDITIDAAGGAGEVNDGENVGAGSGVYKDKSGLNIRLRSIIGGTGVTSTENTDDITLSITNDGVDNTKAANMAEDTIKGRITTGTGDPEDLTPAQVRTMINVEDGATADQSDSEIKTAYENNADTNAFTDADETKLDGIATGAEVNPALISQADAETGTATDERVISAQRLRQGAEASRKTFQVMLVEGTESLVVGDHVSNWSFYVDSKLAGFNIVYVHARVVTAGVTGTTTIQLHNITQAADILSTPINIDTGETQSHDAATQPVIDSTEDDLTLHDLIRVDVDTIQTGTAPQGLFLEIGVEHP